VFEATRHHFACEPLSVDDPESGSRLEEAELFEKTANWYFAGTTYLGLAECWEKTDVTNRARAFARAASCFQIADQKRAAAQAYLSAATSLTIARLHPQVAGELYSCAAKLHHQLGEFWGAGHNWMSAAKAFEAVAEDTIMFHGGGWSGKYFHVARCYSAGGDSFLFAGDNAMWARSAYWEAGRACSRGGLGYHAYVAYRKALVACIRFCQTHDREVLRNCLPLTDEERRAKLDPVREMGRQAFEGNRATPQPSGAVSVETWVSIASDKQIAAAYHEFHLGFAEIGNLREAAVYRAAEKEENRKLFLREHRFRLAAAFWLWKVTSGYGESLGRWLFSCLVVLLLFSGLYFAGDLITPIKHWFDYFYFSLMTFTASGYGDIQPVGFGGKLSVCLEMIVGISMFGVLLTFVANRISR
jgi:hypothetical protein